MGQQKHALDTKGRVTFPAKYRDALLSPVVVARGPENCLRVWPKESFDRLVVELRKDLNSRQRDLRRQILARASDERIDDKGRMVIPAEFRDYASLNEEVVIAGVGDFLEIWDPTEWERRMSSFEADLGDSTDAALGGETFEKGRD